jgi:hypothetical protein
MRCQRKSSIAAQTPMEIRPVSAMLAAHADGIEDTKAGKAWADHGPGH